MTRAESNRLLLSQGDLCLERGSGKPGTEELPESKHLPGCLIWGGGWLQLQKISTKIIIVLKLVLLYKLW